MGTNPGDQGFSWVVSVQVGRLTSSVCCSKNPGPSPAPHIAAAEFSCDCASLPWPSPSLDIAMQESTPSARLGMFPWKFSLDLVAATPPLNASFERGAWAKPSAPAAAARRSRAALDMGGRPGILF